MTPTGDPAAIVAAREGAAAGADRQPAVPAARQRAVLVLRDVLAFPAAEVAVMLGTTTASVKSALQRARARLEELRPGADEIAEPAAPQARELLERYIAAFENADAAELERLLVHDVTLEATPLRTWFAGRKTCVPFLRDHVLGAPGTWRMLPSSANGQPAAVGSSGTPTAATSRTGSRCSPSPTQASTVSHASVTRAWSACSGSPALQG